MIVAAVSFMSAPSVLWYMTVMFSVLEENVSLITFTRMKPSKVVVEKR